MAGDKPPRPVQTISQTTIEGEPIKVKVKRFFHKVYQVVSSLLGLIVALIIYSFIGAAIFRVIEGRHELIEKSEVIDVREDVIQNAWNLSLIHGETEEEFKEVLHKELHRYEQKLHEAFLHGINSDSETMVWDFWGSFLFCATVYTTIGYGHIAPATDFGRAVTMIYALFGIPLCLIVMADLGKKITLGIKFLWAFVRRFYYTGHCRKVRKTFPMSAIKEGLQEGLDKLDFKRKKSYTVNEDAPKAEPEEDEEEEPYLVDDDFNLPPIVAIVIMVSYILIGAGMYTNWEDNWSYLEAFYFIFISISTIGFGDVLPDHPRYFLASSVYILLGLSLVAMVITVFMEVVSSTLDKAKDKVINVGQRMGIDLSVDNIDEIGRDKDKDKDKAKDKKDNGDPPSE